MANFPNDADGMALQMMATRGMDVAKPIRFEFHIHVENENAAAAVVDAVRNAGVGDEAEIVYDQGELAEGEQATESNQEFWPSWTVYVYHEMLPEYSKVVGMQKTLNDVAKPHGGRIDGWGVCQR